MPSETPFVRYGRYGALAFEFSGTIAAGTIIGHYVDRWLGSDPYATVICTLLAVVGGFVRLVQVLRSFDRPERAGEP